MGGDFLGLQVPDSNHTCLASTHNTFPVPIVPQFPQLEMEAGESQAEQRINTQPGLAVAVCHKPSLPP